MASGRADYWWLNDRYKAPATTSRPDSFIGVALNYDSTHRETLGTSGKQEVDSDEESSRSAYTFDPFKGKDQARAYGTFHQDRATDRYPRPQPMSVPTRVHRLPPAPRARSAHQEAYYRLDAKKRKINEDKRQIMKEQRRIQIRAGKRRDQLEAARELVRKAEAEKQIALANARKYTGIRAIRPGR